MSFPIEQVRLNSFPVYLFLVTKICNRIDITKQKQQSFFIRTSLKGINIPNLHQQL